MSWKKFAIGCLGALALIIVLLIVIALAAGGDSSDLVAPEAPGRPASTPTPFPIGTRENPAPIGVAVETSDDWLVTVLSVIPDASEEVDAENIFNRTPKPDHQFFIVRIEAQYIGEGSDRYDASLRLRAVGQSGIAYETFRQSCGVIPDKFIDADLFSGAMIEGNQCWEIDSADADSLLMFDTGGLFSSERNRRWWKLTE